MLGMPCIMRPSAEAFQSCGPCLAAGPLEATDGVAAGLTFSSFAAAIEVEAAAPSVAGAMAGARLGIPSSTPTTVYSGSSIPFALRPAPKIELSHELAR